MIYLYIKIVSGFYIEMFTAVYNQANMYGRVARAWIGPRLLIFLLDPRDVELILSSHIHIDK